MSQQIKNYEEQLKEYLKGPLNYWYLPLIFGVLLVALAIYVFRTPEETYVALAFMFSLAFFIGGVLEVVFAITSRKYIKSWGWTLVLGLVNLFIGIILLKHPEISITTLPFFVGFWVLFRSFTSIGYAMDLSNFGMPGSTTFLILGGLGILIGMGLIFNPIFGGISLVAFTGASILVAGIFNIMLSLKLKEWNKGVDKLVNKIS